MYLDIEKQLNKITDTLKQELLAAKAIDESGRAIDEKKFNEILDEKIAQCNEILATTEENGVTKDIYGANIASARIDKMMRMKEFGSISPETMWQPEDELEPEKATKEDNKKVNAFHKGISKILSKIQGVFRPTRTPEDVR